MNKNLKIIFCSFLLLFLYGMNIQAIEIFLANINILSDNPEIDLSAQEKNFTRLIMNYIDRYDFGGFIQIKPVYSLGYFEKKVTKSLLDASELCELAKIDYLLYGRLIKTENYYDAELKIFDNHNKEVCKIFYCKEPLGDIETLAEDLSHKAATYFRTILGISDQIIKRKNDYHGMFLTHSLGYWLPLSEWSEVLVGIAYIDTGLCIVPYIPAPIDMKEAFKYRFGVSLSYSIGVNNAEYEGSFLQSLAVKVPFEIPFEFMTNNFFVIGLAPLMQIDFVIQNRLYEGTGVVIASGFGFSVPLSFEYWFGDSKDWCLGFNQSVDCIFYDPIQVTFKWKFYVSYQIFKSEIKEKTLTDGN
jgi:hypothetical protein